MRLSLDTREYLNFANFFMRSIPDIPMYFNFIDFSINFEQCEWILKIDFPFLLKQHKQLFDFLGFYTFYLLVQIKAMGRDANFVTA